MLRAAAEEMTEAAAYDEDRRPGMGYRFLGRVQLAVARAEAFPWSGHAWSARHPDVRKLATKGFPYHVVHVTEPVLTVIAVAHAKRRPGYWMDRLPRR